MSLATEYSRISDSGLYFAEIYCEVSSIYCKALSG